MKTYTLSKINRTICWLILSLISINAKAASVQDSVYFESKIAGDSLQIFIHKISRDSAFVYTDTAKNSGTRLILKLVSTKPAIIKNIKNSAFSVAHNLRWEMDSMDFRYSINKVNFNKYYEFTCFGPGFYLADSGKQMLFSCELNKFSDTILADVFMALVAPVKTSSLIYPVFINNPNKRISNNAYIFCDAEKGKTANLGIHYSNYKTQDLNYGACIGEGLVCMVFDANTHLRKPVGSIVPNCQWGAKWTTFGHFEDYQIYYTFDLNTPGDSAEFITFLKTIDDCDLLAMFSRIELDTRRISKPMDSLMGIFGSNLFKNDTTKVAYAFLGRKGFSRGKAAEAMSKTGYVGVNEPDMNLKGGECTKFEMPVDTSIKFIYYTVKPAVNAIQKITKNQLQLYPNPNNGNGFTLQFESSVNKASVQVISLQGVVIYQQNSELNGANKLQVNAQFKPGIYMVRTECGGQVFVQKIQVACRE